jgi:indole-3-glycerol phosphate synthase
MNVLDKIVADKKIEVAHKKMVVPISQLVQTILFGRKTFSITSNIKKNNSGIIAEFKRRSPSKSIINFDSNVEEVIRGYELAGVSAISVLTDVKYFGGSLDDLLVARASVALPVLRKEFIVDPYQIYESKSFGADVILLIASVLTAEEIRDFTELAHEMGMEVLLEVHNLEELQNSFHSNIDMVGVNNRNLKTFEVSLENSKRLSVHIPKNVIKISESGISTKEDILELKNYGFTGFLMGENFMKTKNPGLAASEFIKELNQAII